MRLSKLDAAARLGVSPSTIDRMIRRGQLKAENEPHGTRYKVWVLFDGESSGESPDEPSDKASSANGQSSDAPSNSPRRGPDESALGELLGLREKVKNLEELADYRKQLLDDSEWRYHQLVQQLNLSQEANLVLVRALPSAIGEISSSEPTSENVTPPRRRWWWPFSGT